MDYTDKLKEFNLPFPLREYQLKGVKFLCESDSALLADDMGLGKTVQVAVSLNILKKLGLVLKTLIIVPSSLKTNWENELSIWAPNLSVRILSKSGDRIIGYLSPVNVLIASYDEIRIDALKIPRKSSIDLVVIDEAQKIKNTKSKISLYCKLLRRNRSWALTGTPIENNIYDLYSILQFVRSELQINDNFSKKSLHNLMKPYFLRRRKEDVLDELPELIEQEIALELNESQRIAYNETLKSGWNNLKKLKNNYNTTNILALITKLKQICNFDSSTNTSSKLLILNSIIEENLYSGSKIIIFSQYVETLKWLEAYIKFKNSLLFHGRIKQTNRDKIISNFKKSKGPQILLASLGAGGVGLNLQEADIVVLYDRWWNPSVENQAVSRAHRMGRKGVLHVIKFLVIGTIEERISELLADKTELFDEYIEGAENTEKIVFDKQKLLEIIKSGINIVN